MSLLITNMPRSDLLSALERGDWDRVEMWVDHCEGLKEMKNVPAGVGKHNPEDTVWDHTLNVMKSVTGHWARFAALLHDIGKLHTDPEMWPRHHQHDKLGIEPLLTFCDGIGMDAVDPEAVEIARLVCKYHMKLHRWDEMSPGTIVRMFNECGDAMIYVALIARADGCKIEPALVKELYLRVGKIDLLLSEHGGDEVNKILMKQIKEVKKWRKEQAMYDHEDSLEKGGF